MMSYYIIPSKDFTYTGFMFIKLIQVQILK